jgi:hypothetical protein
MAGRPVWVVGDACVPRLTQVPVLRRDGTYAIAQPAEDALNARGRPWLLPELAMALDHLSEESASALLKNEDAKAQARWLIAAAYRDILRLRPWVEDGGSWEHDPTQDSIASVLGYGSRDTARKAVRRGRDLWPRLAAWPWWPLRAGGYWPGRGPLPDPWWTLPLVAASFDAWRDPAAFVADQAVVRHQMRKEAA